MSRPRFRIASLLVLILLVALGVAALRASDDAWECAVFGATLLILLAAILPIAHRTDEKRAFWMGLALFGWAYLGFSLVPPVEVRLPTTKALAYLDSKVPGRETNVLYRWTSKVNGGNVNNDQVLAFSPDGRRMSGLVRGNVRIWDTTTGTPLTGPSGTKENFVRIGHSLVALMLAFLGGHLSLSLHAGGGRRQEDDPSRPSLP